MLPSFVPLWWESRLARRNAQLLKAMSKEANLSLTLGSIVAYLRSISKTRTTRLSLICVRQLITWLDASNTQKHCEHKDSHHLWGNVHSKQMAKLWMIQTMRERTYILHINASNGSILVLFWISATSFFTCMSQRARSPVMSMEYWTLVNLGHAKLRNVRQQWSCLEVLHSEFVCHELWCIQGNLFTLRQGRMSK